MYDTIQIPQVWKPSLYMYLSIALSFSTHEGHFYWYTDSKAGPAFSEVNFLHNMGHIYVTQSHRSCFKLVLCVCVRAHTLMYV